MVAPRPDDVYGWAKLYLAAGLSVIPVRLDGTKGAYTGWREYSERRPTPAELSAWFAGRRAVRHGIGIPGGPASGNLLVFDFESRTAFDRWCLRLTDDDKRYLAASPVVGTPRDGIHVYVRLTDSVKGALYARTVDGSCLIETRGSNHMVVAPGSPLAVHPSGRPYQLLRAGWIDGCPFEVMPLDVFHVLTAHAADLDEHVRPVAREVVGDRPSAGEVGDRPGDRFNERVSWGDILCPHRWSVYRSTAGATYWCRPGKSPAGISASTGHCRGPSGRDLFYVFTSSIPQFEPRKSYSRFAVYANLNHRGDFTAATRALGRAGYGTQTRKVVMK